MKRSSTTKKALLISTCALLFSMLMMAGSTFAWFTDSVRSGTNTITTGKLDVQLLHTNQKVTEAKEVQQNTLLFTDEKGNSIDWEPGAGIRKFHSKEHRRSGAELQTGTGPQQCQHHCRNKDILKGRAEGQGFGSCGRGY